jgi:hypothetical protein
MHRPIELPVDQPIDHAAEQQSEAREDLQLAYEALLRALRDNDGIGVRHQSSLMQGLLTTATDDDLWQSIIGDELDLIDEHTYGGRYVPAAVVRFLTPLAEAIGEQLELLDS